MKKLLVLGFLLGCASSVLRADTVAAPPTGGSAAVHANASTGTRAAKKAKRRRGKKVKAEVVSLFVTDEGFLPKSITVKKGQPVQLVVTRQTDRTCATSIVIPGYGLSSALPLNVPETLSFTPKAAGDIRYSCGMGMLSGVLSVE